jgi:CrcB protein
MCGLDYPFASWLLLYRLRYALAVVKWTYLIFGSIAGGLFRYVVAGAIYKKWGTGFPTGTLIVNLTGCLLIGFFNSLAREKFILGPNDRLLLMTGFCGAYTTFSALILETSNLLREGEAARALTNLLLSVIVGFLLFRAGEWIGKAI